MGWSCSTPFDSKQSIGIRQVRLGSAPIIMPRSALITDWKRYEYLMNKFELSHGSPCSESRGHPMKPWSNWRLTALQPRMHGPLGYSWMGFVQRTEASQSEDGGPEASAQCVDPMMRHPLIRDSLALHSDPCTHCGSLINSSFIYESGKRLGDSVVCCPSATLRKIINNPLGFPSG